MSNINTKQTTIDLKENNNNHDTFTVNSQIYTIQHMCVPDT